MAGDNDLYAELVRRHHPAVIAFCTSMLFNRASAEDAAQETFLSAHAALESYRADAAFTTWLYRIATNKCLDIKRKAARSKTQSFEALLEENGDHFLSAFSEKGPENALESAQLVQSILSCLPDAYRVALTLRELQGLEYEEIARAMECSVDSVKARLQRARREFLGKLRHLTSAGDVSSMENL